MSKMLLLEKTWDSSRVTSVENFASSWSHNVVVKFPEVEVLKVQTPFCQRN